MGRPKLKRGQTLPGENHPRRDYFWRQIAKREYRQWRRKNCEYPWSWHPWFVFEKRNPRTLRDVIANSTGPIRFDPSRLRSRCIEKLLCHIADQPSQRRYFPDPFHPFYYRSRFLNRSVLNRRIDAWINGHPFRWEDALSRSDLWPRACGTLLTFIHEHKPELLPELIKEHGGYQSLFLRVSGQCALACLPLMQEYHPNAESAIRYIEGLIDVTDILGAD